MPSKRKSWLPFSNGKSKPNDQDPGNERKEPSAEGGANGTEGLNNHQGQPSGEARLRPIQFEPNRLATLYVTPSERNLYLAAMSQLDQSPPHLALWSDPAPSLPHIQRSQAPLPANWPQSAQTVPMPMSMTGATRNAKLVTSPEAQTNGGLMIRDEFRRLPPAAQVRHASITLTAGGGLRFVQFPANVLIDLEEHFPANKVFSEPVSSLRQRSTNVVPLFSVDMFGSMWKRAGSEELDPIRLLVAILGSVGTHGWTVINSIKAGTAKNDVKTLVLAHSDQTAFAPPAYFAISFPLPDRISLVFPPPKATPALLSAVRDAITATTSGAAHSRSGTANTADTQVTDSPDDKPRITWKERKAKIKVEGWVRDGVYGFKIDGMRRKLVGGVKKDVVASLQPLIVLNIISALASLHYMLSTSVSLQPSAAGRDILIFASQPDTGVPATDASRPKAPRPSSPQSSRSESPVLVQRTASLPPPVEDVNDPRTVDPERRVLPWTSTVMSDQPTAEQRAVPDSPTRAEALPQPRSQSELRDRGPSVDSARPLLQSSSVQSSPRPRNVLLKKNSIRNRTSSSESRQHSVRAHSRQASDAGAGAIAVPPAQSAAPAAGNDRDTWAMIDPPTHVGHMGVTMHSNVDTEQQALAATTHQTIPAPQITSIGAPPLPPRQASDQQSISGESVYETPAADVLLNPPPPRPHQEFTSSNLPLGKPMERSDASVVSSIPAHLHLKAPRSPNRVNHENVDIGIPSVYGSVGYLPSMVSQNPSMVAGEPIASGHDRSTSEALDVLMGQGGQADGLVSVVEDRKGKGKEGSRRVWDEDRGAWVDLPAVQGNVNGSGSDRPGSTRTRVSLG